MYRNKLINGIQDIYQQIYKLTQHYDNKSQRLLTDSL